MGKSQQGQKYGSSGSCESAWYGTCIGSPLEQVAKNVLQARNVNVIFVDLDSFFRSVIALCPDLTFTTFLAKVQNYAISVRVRDEVFEHIERVSLSIQIPVEPAI